MDGKATSAFKRFLGHFHFARSKKDGGKDERPPGALPYKDEPPKLSAQSASRHRTTLQSGAQQPNARQPGPPEQPSAATDSHGGASAAVAPRSLTSLNAYDFKDAHDVLDKVLSLSEDEAADEDALRLLCAELLRRAEVAAQGGDDARPDCGLTAARAAFEFSKFLLNDSAEMKRACQTRLLQAIEACDRTSGQPPGALSAASTRTAFYYSTVA